MKSNRRCTLNNHLIYNDFLKQVTAKEVAARKRIVVEDDQILYIKQGVVSVKKNNKILYFATAGDFVGAEQLFCLDICSLEYFSTVASNIMIFSKEKFVDFLIFQQKGELVLLAQQQSLEYYWQKHNLLKINQYNRLVYVLQFLAQKFGNKIEDGYMLPKWLAMEDLADYTNLSVNTLKKNLGLLETNLLIRMEGSRKNRKIFINDPINQVIL